MLWDGAACCHHGDRAKGGWCTVGDSGPVPNWSLGLCTFCTLPSCFLLHCRCTVTFKLVCMLLKGHFTQIKKSDLIIVTSSHADTSGFICLQSIIAVKHIPAALNSA